MFDSTTIEFFHSGCAVLIGSTDADATPHAGRGWGLTVVDATAGRVRVLADAADEVTLANLRVGSIVAITTASVRTLRSIQLKGRVVSVEAATEVDIAKQQQYTKDFIGDIHETDGEPMEMLTRWSDCGVVPFVIDVDDSFDQTPGPSAGTRMAVTDS